MKSIQTRIEELATCLCAQIVSDGNGEVCFCGVMPGAEIAFDYIGNCGDDGPCGMAYVNLTDAQPANGVATPNTEVNNCGSLLGFSIEIGILRCVPIEKDGEPPDPAVLLAVSRIVNADIKTMQRAVACCSPKPYILGTYQPYGPTGAVIGGTFDLTMLEE